MKKRKWKKFLSRAEPSTPAQTLRFTPMAWAKLEFFRDKGTSEIGGFGITAPEDRLLVVEFQTVKQKASGISVGFDDEAVADFFDSQADLGRKPDTYGRIWCHTHPGNSACPSSVDEATFSRVFGGCEWALMFILARGGSRYARLRFNVGPGGQLQVPVSVDFRAPFQGSDQKAWEEEYAANIQADPVQAFSSLPTEWLDPDDYLDTLAPAAKGRTGFPWLDFKGGF
jgi:hypothetical protein